MSRQSAPVGISAREAEILALVGEHRSNAEIAAQLFISVRTVETHVSSLLRKLGVPDRRALAGLAIELAGAERTSRALAGLPAPVNPFIGRDQERAALRDAVEAHRQVTAVGPGGVGKTRLALAVAADLAGGFEDGVWFVDLVPVTDPAMVGSAVAAALGLGEQQGRSIDDSVLAALADRRALLVLDNCEHLGAGVAPFIERLLARCPRVSVLTTSRARLLVPFEWVYSVPPLSLHGPDDGAGDVGSSDAVSLFLDRAVAVGWPLKPEHLTQAAEVCRKLDGVALAIEIAAARLPALGLDGLVAGLSDHLRLLVGGYRAEERHRSVRAMLDWSQALLSSADSALLRRVSIFVSPFTAPAAAQVAGFPPLDRGAVADGLARLADQSLLIVTASASGTRYRALETIRQYGIEQLTATGELASTRVHHVRWCLATASGLAQEPSPATGGWRARFDAVADDVRAALGWAAEEPEYHTEAHDLAQSLAGLAFSRNLAGEAQRRYEQAAALTEHPAAATALRYAAEVAACRMRGDDTYHLWQAAADAAQRAGDTAAAARDLATAAAAYFRMSGVFAQLPPPEEATALLTRARDLAGGDLAGQTAVVLAECGVLGHAFFAGQAEPKMAASQTIVLAEHAVELARRLHDPLVESAALYALTGAQRRAGDTFAAAATARRRVGLLHSVPASPAAAFELIDALLIATATSIGVGDLLATRQWGRQLRDLPLLAEVGHVATSRLLVADGLAGRAADVIADSGRFLDAWTQASRPRAPGFGAAAAAVAMIHGLRGDQAGRAEWLDIIGQLGVTPAGRSGYRPTFDAITLLHHGQAPRALQRLGTQPGEPDKWLGIWRPWHIALRAEAAMLAGHPDANHHLTTARAIVAGNPIATAILDRAAALLDDDHERLLTTAAAFEAAGCPYQRARTLILAGGDTASAGHAALADLGLTSAAAPG